MTYGIRRPNEACSAHNGCSIHIIAILSPHHQLQSLVPTRVDSRHAPVTTVSRNNLQKQRRMVGGRGFGCSELATSDALSPWCLLREISVVTTHDETALTRSLAGQAR